MKIEIDLNDILHDEHSEPTETLAESIRRQVVDRLAQDARAATENAARAAVNAAIAEGVKTAIDTQIPALIDDLLDAEYMPVSRYGAGGELTSVRKELLKHLTEVAVISKGGYSSDKNAWTKAIEESVGSKLREFQSLWLKEVDARFMAQAMQYAAEAFAKRAGIALKGG